MGTACSRSRAGDPRAGEQECVTSRYERVARLYDLWSAPMELFGMRIRHRRLLEHARGRVLEAGVGTGRNLEHYPQVVEMIGKEVGRVLA